MAVVDCVQAPSARLAVPELDVLVLGAGPAGTTAATLLAQAGLSVEVLEKARFPRHHVGESLLPCDLPIFDRLGLTLSPETALRKAGAEFYDESTGRHAVYPFTGALPPAADHAFQVDRARFDADLSRVAERAGAGIHFGCKVVDLCFAEDRVQAVAADGTERSARFLIDATGQDAFVGRRRRAIQPLYGFGIGAVYAHFADLGPEPRAELEADGNIRILLLEDGWAWLIPLPGGRLSVGRVSRTPGVSENLLDALLDGSPVLRRLTEGASRGAVRVVRNFSFRNREAFGARYACVGDAATFLDPVFSSGVSLGMQGAATAADRLIDALARGDEADPLLMSPVAEHMRHAYVSFGSLIQSFYQTRLAHHFFFHPDPDPELRAGLSSMLAGDVWRDDNRFQQSLLSGRRRWDLDEGGLATPNASAG